MTKEEYRKDFYDRMRAEHRCTSCAVELPEGYTYARCPACTKKHKNSGTRRYLERISHYQCVRCGAQMPYGYRYCQCQKCREKDKERRAKKNVG